VAIDLISIPNCLLDPLMVPPMHPAIAFALITSNATATAHAFVAAVSAKVGQHFLSLYSKLGHASTKNMIKVIKEFIRSTE
jgi:hypothetical protein